MVQLPFPQPNMYWEEQRVERTIDEYKLAAQVLIELVYKGNPAPARTVNAHRYANLIAHYFFICHEQVMKRHPVLLKFLDYYPNRGWCDKAQLKDPFGNHASHVINSA